MRLARWLRKTNLKVAVLSVLLAITLWFFQAMSNDYSTTIQLPIKVVEPGSFFKYGQPTEEIDVFVSGKGWSLFWHSLGIVNDTVFIPLKKLSKTDVVDGREIQSLMDSKIFGLSIKGIKTDRINVNFDKLAEKKVLLRLKKKYQKRYYFDRIPTLSYREITLKGPKRSIDTLANSYTFGVTDSMLALESPLVFDLRNEYPEVIEMSNDKCELFYSFKSSVLHTISSKVKFLNLPFLKSLTTPSEYVDVTYKVNVEDNNSVKPEDFEVYADYDKSEKGFLPLRVDYLGEVKLNITSYSPNKISKP